AHAPLPLQGLVAIEALARQQNAPITVTGPPHSDVGLAVAVEVTSLERNISRRAPLPCQSQEPIKVLARLEHGPLAIAGPPHGHIGRVIAGEVIAEPHGHEAPVFQNFQHQPLPGSLGPAELQDLMHALQYLSDGHDRILLRAKGNRGLPGSDKADTTWLICL